MFDLASFIKQLGATISFFWNLLLSVGAFSLVISLSLLGWMLYTYKKSKAE